MEASVRRSKFSVTALGCQIWDGPLPKRRIEMGIAVDSGNNDVVMAVILTSRERSKLKSRAHHLSPIVRVGVAGLTPAFVKEVDRALADHELIKVRIDIEDREARDQAADDICARTDSARVQRLGKTLVLWRPRPDDDEDQSGSRPPAPGTMR